ncbi:hypothetical protein ACE1CD_23885 [Aerosakkonema sp. BLCC-F183]|uniref:hypothetical protein n=1 Tax=Aerosakkonema sp. BLCC-F183 TaxID=3342834 RepID=UPI0035B850A0
MKVTLQCFWLVQIFVNASLHISNLTLSIATGQRSQDGCWVDIRTSRKLKVKNNRQVGEWGSGGVGSRGRGVAGEWGRGGAKELIFDF